MQVRTELQPLVDEITTMNASEQVYFINKVFGNQFGNNTQEKVIDQTMNMYDEAEEFLVDGLEANNPVEVVDAIGDLLTFGYGIGYLMGENAQKIGVTDAKNTSLTNRELVDSVVNMTDKFLGEFRLKRDIESSYHNLMGVVKGMCVVNDIDEDELMTRITVSNLTKLCMTFDECQDTINNYMNKGVEVYAKYFNINGFWVHVVYSAKEQTVDGKVYRANKFLKCVHFKEPMLQDLV